MVKAITNLIFACRRRLPAKGKGARGGVSMCTAGGGKSERWFFTRPALCMPAKPPPPLTLLYACTLSILGLLSLSTSLSHHRLLKKVSTAPLVQEPTAVRLDSLSARVQGALAERASQSRL